MAFAYGNLVSWTDIVNLFSNLNTARQKFGYGAVTPANAGFGQGVKTTTAQVSNLKSYIEQVSNHSLVGSTALTGVTVPAVGSLLKFDIFNKFTTTIANISNTCLNFGNFSNNGFNSSDFGDFGDKSSNHSSDFGDKSSNHSSDFGHFGDKSSNHSSNHSFNSTCFEFNSSFSFNRSNDYGESNNSAGCPNKS